MKKTTDNFNCIDQIIRRVSDCNWNPFKLNEILTLQRCLQEVSVQDPQFNLILRKLANESIFVEPSRRLKHLARTKQEEQSDIEYRRRETELRGQIEKLSEEIEIYTSHLDELETIEKDLSSQIIQLDKSIVSIDRICKLLTDEFGLLLLRVYDSFDSSLAIIQEQIPEYVRAISKSKLIQQTEALPVLYRKSILKLLRLQQRRDNQNLVITSDKSLPLVLHFKRLAKNHVSDYLKAALNLYRDLLIVDSLYSCEIAAELDHVRAFGQHVEYLKQPIAQRAPKRTIYLHRGIAPATTPLADIQASNEQPDLNDDRELSRLLNAIAIHLGRF